MNLHSLTIKDKPYETCEVPTSVPTKWLLYSMVIFFFLTTIAIMAFIKYDDNRTVLKSHHEAEVKKLVIELQALRKIIDDREAASKSRAIEFLETLKRHNIELPDNLKPKKEWKQVREPTQLEGIDDGYELVEVK